MKKTLLLLAFLGLFFIGGPEQALGETITSEHTINPGECVGEKCLLHMFFTNFLSPDSKRDGFADDYGNDLIPATIDTQTTISINASLPIISPGDSFKADINWRGESTAIGAHYYDTPAIIIKPNGDWESVLDNMLNYKCLNRNAGNLIEGEDALESSCSPIAGVTLLMKGKWEDKWEAEVEDSASGAFVQTTKITCQSNTTGTSALCQADASLVPGEVRVKLVRTLRNAELWTTTNNIVSIPMLEGEHSMNSGPVRGTYWKRIIRAYNPFPAEMVSYADIEIRDGCTPDLTPAVSGCVDPASGITASWNICGANTGTYAVELEKQTADSWVPVQTKQFTGNSVTSTVFDLSAQIEDAVYKYRVKKTDGGGSGQWSSPEVVTIGLAPGNPSVNAPAQASAGTPVNFSWAHAASDITASRIGTSVLNIASTVLNGTKTGSAWQTQWVANSTAGDYPYTVTSSHPLGCGDGNASGTVEVTEVANQDPVASLTVTPVSGNTGTAFTADGSASSDPDGTIASYDWQVTGTSGETVAFQIVPGSNGQRITFTGDADGNYSVVLIVTDDRGATDQATAVVTVTDGSSIVPTPTSDSDPGDIYEDD